MRSVWSSLAALALFAAPLPAQTADSIVARYIRGIGGMEHIQAINTVRLTGHTLAGGGVEVGILQEAKRPNKVRAEFSLQGMTGITAYDGQNGWKIMPFEGKKDAEALGEDELKAIVEEADIDGPLVNYQQKHNTIELLGTDQVEGTDVYKLKVTLPGGDFRIYYLDSESYVPIKIERHNFIRGTEQVMESLFGNYQTVAGVLLPYSVESRQPGNPQGAKVTFDRIEVNIPIDDSRFVRPAAPAPAPQPPQQQPEGGN